MSDYKIHPFKIDSQAFQGLFKDHYPSLKAYACLFVDIETYEASFFDPDKNEIIRKLYMNDLRDEIDQAIESLPQKCREVFTLSYIMDTPNKEISKLLDISCDIVF